VFGQDNPEGHLPVDECLHTQGGKDDLKAAADALHKVRDVGVGPSLRAALERRAARDDDRS
jgi:hypothetical protein